MKKITDIRRPRMWEVALTAFALAAPFVLPQAVERDAGFVTRAVAQETAQDENLTCNAVCPGTVDTPAILERIARSAAGRGVAVAQAFVGCALELPPDRLDMLVGAYNYLDLVPKGRDEDKFAFNMAWLRHHDRYDGGQFADPNLPFWPDAAKSDLAAMASSSNSSHCCGSHKHPGAE